MPMVILSEAFSASLVSPSQRSGVCRFPAADKGNQRTRHTSCYPLPSLLERDRSNSEVGVWPASVWGAWENKAMQRQRSELVPDR